MQKTLTIKKKIDKLVYNEVQNFYSFKRHCKTKREATEQEKLSAMHITDKGSYLEDVNNSYKPKGRKSPPSRTVGKGFQQAFYKRGNPKHQQAHKRAQPPQLTRECKSKPLHNPYNVFIEKD